MGGLATTLRREPFALEIFPARPRTGPYAGSMPHRSRIVPLTLMLVAFVASGCSGSSSAGKTVSGWFGGDGDSAKAGERVYYVAVEGLDVREQPNSSSKAVASLRLHEKVVRTKQSNAYAFVRARGGRLEGWVLNSRLDWRAPAAGGVERDGTEKGGAAKVGATKGGAAQVGAEPAAEDPAADPVVDSTAPATGDETADAAVQSVAPDVEPQPETAEPAPSPPPSTEPAAPAATKKKGMGASVFDPY